MRSFLLAPRDEEKETLTTRRARQAWAAHALSVRGAALRSSPAAPADMMTQGADVEQAMRAAFDASVARGTPGDSGTFADAVARLTLAWQQRARPAPVASDAGRLPMPLTQTTRRGGREVESLRW